MKSLYTAIGGPPKMNATQRRIEIFQLLQAKGSVEVGELADLFQVTTMTIRRDLSLFEKQGLLTTTYGGALLNQGSGVEPSFNLKRGQMAQEKQLIAKKASELISDGNSMILDCGTTPLEILKYIERKKLTIITNSWPAIGYLQGNTKVQLILAPGEYNEVSAGAISSTTIDFVSSYFVDIVFISTQGFDIEFGASVPDPTDAMVKSALLKSGRKKVLLVDSSKINKRYLARHAFPNQFDVIVTDSGVSQEHQKALSNLCEQLFVVGNPDQSA